ncbi:MAG: RDD family protein [Cyanobacteria bacterium SZAS TMP-1]|nr:RDD family protein [Cyanobacteria bacterium SZAS TMP-1]
MTRSGRPNRKPDEGRRGSEAGASGLSGKLSTYQNWVNQRWAIAVVEPERIEPGRRLMAVGIDFGAAFVISMFIMMIPLVNRVLTQNLVLLLLLCFRDYFYSGRGLGKNIMGLKVVDIFTGQPPGLKQVLVRNLIYLGPLLLMEALQRILSFIPLTQVTVPVGACLNFLAGLYVLVILPLECYRSYQRDDSMRLGDEIAGTCLLESETDFSGFLPK